MISTEQLLAAGLGRGGISLRVRRGRLHPYHRGVYAVGHTRVTGRARLWAAVMARGGPGAALLGCGSAAAPWELMRVPSGRIDVITLRQSCSTKAIRVHRTMHEPQDISRMHRYEVDFYWPTHRLIAETDGAAAHLTPTAFERDRARDAHLTALGYRVIRITWRQMEQPESVARLLRRLLAE